MNFWLTGSVPGKKKNFKKGTEKFPCHLFALDGSWIFIVQTTIKEVHLLQKMVSAPWKTFVGKANTKAWMKSQ